MYACKVCDRFACTCGAVARAEAACTIWRVCRGSQSVPTGPDHATKEAAMAWGRENMTGFYTVYGL